MLQLFNYLIEGVRDLYIRSIIFTTGNNLLHRHFCEGEGARDITVVMPPQSSIRL